MYQARVGNASGGRFDGRSDRARDDDSCESRMWSRVRPEGRTCYEVPVLAN